MNEAHYHTTEKDPQTRFETTLNDILYTKVSVENIRTFADEALNQLIALNESVVSAYQKDYPEFDQYTGLELEDKAYAAFNLPDLNTILGRITTVQENIAQILVSVSESLVQIPTVITPTDTREPSFTGNGITTYESPNTLDRLVTLAYILERDFDLTTTDVKYTKGITTDSMLRKEPYVRVEVPSLERLVYVCDEEGNASYVFDSTVLEALGTTKEDVDVMSKNTRNAFLRLTPSAGKRVVQSPEWRQVMSKALSESFDQDEQLVTTETIKPISEFAEKMKLSYEEFLVEVREEYELAGRPSGVSVWYKAVYKNHPGWPAAPEQKYNKSGWKSYPVMVGNEVVEFLEYKEFSEQVQNQYETAGRPSNVFDWYKEIFKDHPGWPASPEQKYKIFGITGYSAMVGKEELLEYQKFIDEVKKEYEAAGRPDGVSVWYKNNYKKHPRWPASPDQKYIDSGWEGYLAMVGGEKVKLLPYQEFLADVKKEYEKAGKPGGVKLWYSANYDKHAGWPANPNKFYQNVGFKNYSTMVGNDAIELLPYQEFLADVKKEYEKAGRPDGVSIWYKDVYKNHTGWPAVPARVFYEFGLKSYAAMVGNEVVEFLLYKEFLADVKKEYEKAGRPDGVSVWYNNNYKNHISWPANPNRIYKSAGWKGYPAMVGKE